MNGMLNGITVAETMREGGVGCVENSCPICETVFFIAEPDFNSAQSCFCPNPKCNFWLVLDNETNEKDENEKRRVLASLNERRRLQTKKWQREDFNNRSQPILFDHPHKG